MSVKSHIHVDDIIVDPDVHFAINTTTRMISNQNEDKVNKKLTLMQYDNKSERYSFDIDRKIDNHDLMSCNKVTVHFINIGSGRGQRNAGTYTVTDMHEHDTDPNKITFSWLIGNEATQYAGVLHFLISFECINNDEVLYRWSTTTFTGLQVVAGMRNEDEILDVYSDELLVWQNNLENELITWQSSIENEIIPIAVDERYIDRDFATSEEVAYIFDMTEPDDLKLMSIDDVPIDGSSNLVKSGGVKTYIDSAIAALEARLSALQ